MSVNRRSVDCLMHIAYTALNNHNKNMHSCIQGDSMYNRMDSTYDSYKH